MRRILTGFVMRDIGHEKLPVGYSKPESKTTAALLLPPKHRATDTYFPMLSFLQPGARQEKVEWFMDRYTEARATYPTAKFHFIAHSHGTYLLAKALLDYPSVRFNQVVFAGSVVQRNYQWQKFIPHRVKSVPNLVATADWVVVFFPKALQSIGIQDMGSARHDGFQVAKMQPRVIEPDTYIVGGHGAALQEAMWDSIA